MAARANSASASASSGSADTVTTASAAPGAATAGAARCVRQEASPSATTETAAAPANAPLPNRRSDIHQGRSWRAIAPSTAGQSEGGGSGRSSRRAAVTIAASSAIEIVQRGQAAACARTACASVAGRSPSTNAESVVVDCLQSWGSRVAIVFACAPASHSPAQRR